MKKLVIRTPNHLGDCIMSLPAIKSLAESEADHQLYLLAPDWSRPIYEGFHNAIFLPIQKQRLHGWRGIIYQIRLLRRFHFDSGIIMPPSFSSALIFFLGKVRERFGFQNDNRSFLLNHSIGVPLGKTVHRASLFQMLVNRYCETEHPACAPSLQISPDSRENADNLLSKLPTNSAMVSISPQAVAESRRWGSVNYRALSEKLIAEFHCRIILLGSAPEYEAGERVFSGNENIINLCGKTDIGSAAAILSRCRIFVGNDSGLAHLAAAVNIPLVVLSGADNPDETSPFSDRKTVIIKNHLSCISCVKNCCPLKGEDFMRCMREISVGEVFSAVTELLNKYQS